MKKNNHISKIIITVIILQFCSCSDDSTGPSFNEKGYLSGKLNGDYWVPETSFGIPTFPSHLMIIGKLIHYQFGAEFIDQIPLEKYDNNFNIIIEAGYNTFDKAISFRLDSVKDVGHFEFLKSVSAKNDRLGFDYSDLKTGKVEITDLQIDTTHVYNSDEEKWYVNIENTSYVKGKFEFYFEDEEGNILNVTEGNFFLENQFYF